MLSHKLITEMDEGTHIEDKRGRRMERVRKKRHKGQIELREEMVPINQIELIQGIATDGPNDEIRPFMNSNIVQDIDKGNSDLDHQQ